MAVVRRVGQGSPLDIPASAMHEGEMLSSATRR
jgi:hypothetical protein